MLITSDLKDKVLTILFDNYPYGHYHIDDDAIYKELSIDFHLLNSILEQFQQKGLISGLNARPHAIFLSVEFANASDFINSGGYQAEEKNIQYQKALLELEIKKLRIEIENLSKSNPKILPSLNRLLDTAGNIASIASLLIK